MTGWYAERLHAGALTLSGVFRPHAVAFRVRSSLYDVGGREHRAVGPNTDVSRELEVYDTSFLLPRQAQHEEEEWLRSNPRAPYARACLESRHAFMRA